MARDESQGQSSKGAKAKCTLAEAVAKTLLAKAVYSMHWPNLLKEFEKRETRYLRARAGSRL